VTSPGDRPTALLDVTVLIDLVDPRHVHHEICHGWFAERVERPWATWAITQNAELRILGHPRHPKAQLHRHVADAKPAYFHYGWLHMIRG
jgi:predicted nucleic acid-binding protein